MDNVTRRNFLGMAAGAAASAALAAPALADQINYDVKGTGDTQAAPVSEGGKPGKSFEAGVEDFDAATFRAQLLEDHNCEYTCADGTVIPAVYNQLRALINTLGLGNGSEVTDASFAEAMYLFSEDEAAAYITMPVGEFFTATEWAARTGRDEAECLELCETLATRGLLYRERRAGVPYFHLLAEAHGIWEYNLIRVSAEETGNLADFSAGEEVKKYSEIHQNHWGADIITHLYNSETPFYYAVPVEENVVADTQILPYDDYKAVIERNTTLAVSPCQCRLRRKAMGDYTNAVAEGECDHPLETCISTGMMAEYYIENGIGRQIDQEEALAIVQRSVDAGMVIQSCYTKDSEIFCSCHGDCCDILASYVACGSDVMGSLNSTPQISHYRLEVDHDACLKCGACAQRCPLFAITMDETEGPVVNNVCVRCGQCATVCPVEARKLVQKDESEILELPQNMLEDYVIKGNYRMSHGYVY